ncbi:23381_t:CDS:1 [Dentiscutata erythropus]|uniref:23381_t:CDS:1 n=1 Tax=Dentiscutata erythropus TaxID=1348616 RepID=A0A9N8WHW5_9GLOM|nr:23381_t:CDS:1 [Dentiscutata erythropus]
MSPSENMNDVQEKKYILMTLKEEWEKTEKNLAARRNLTIAHLVVSIITIIIGVFLLLIEQRKNTDKIMNIVTSGVTATGGILALIKIIGEYAMSNKENIKTLIQATRTVNNGDVFIPMLISISDNHLKQISTKDHKLYLEFLKRINALVRRERDIGILLAILASCYVIVLATISILINIGYVDRTSTDADRYLALSIIFIGGAWFTNIALATCERFIEYACNIHWGVMDLDDPNNLDNLDHYDIRFKGICWRIGFAILFIPMIFLIGPLSNYYFLMQRMYLIEWSMKIDKVKFYGNSEEREKCRFKFIDHINSLTYFSKVFLRQKGDRKFIIEPIELTDDQKTQLRRLMCGLELEIKNADVINLNHKNT